ncbi:hypothetical protein [Hymenobacter psychrotolerans]|uniref:Uncharacterized protein n=1 Tax=Hymenobacter psychrotolerans DSM 18569 TaxID=1121959 RepID=A0A1M6PDY2_9BACT|nr:hypothetical protein [Hymenobacter psychrotolerans]SHK06165.1 hypothetical protein SAMN02746009_00208 [Hymenobacter psychrotolerans DSM 18569]
MRPASTIYSLPVLLGLLACGFVAKGQAGAEPEPALAASVAAAQQQYDASFTAHPQLYNGVEYADYSRRYHARTGHQFFLSAERQQGSAFYNEHHFLNLPLSYDLVLDQLVLQQNSNSLLLRMVSEKVRYFDIGSHHFVRLVADTTKGNVLRTGFYEVLQQGRVQVLAQRAKRLQEQLKDRNTDVVFIPADRLFARKDGVYYAVRSKGAVKRLFADKAKEVQAYMQTNNLRLSKAQFESTLVELTRYYNTLGT